MVKKSTCLITKQQCLWRKHRDSLLLRWQTKASSKLLWNWPRRCFMNQLVMLCMSFCDIFCCKSTALHHQSEMCRVIWHGRVDMSKLDGYHSGILRHYSVFKLLLCWLTWLAPKGSRWLWKLLQKGKSFRPEVGEDVKSSNLSPNEAIVVAQNRPHWRPTLSDVSQKKTNMSPTMSVCTSTQVSTVVHVGTSVQSSQRFTSAPWWMTRMTRD